VLKEMLRRNKAESKQDLKTQFDKQHQLAKINKALLKDLEAINLNSKHVSMLNEFT
jgi:hypothetical protein